MTLSRLRARRLPSMLGLLVLAVARTALSADAPVAGGPPAPPSASEDVHARVRRLVELRDGIQQAVRPAPAATGSVAPPAVRLGRPRPGARP